MDLCHNMDYLSHMDCFKYPKSSNRRLGLGEEGPDEDPSEMLN